MDGHYVINLGRQLGSGGKEIGEKLANDLGIAFYDKELINLASEESGLCKEFFEKADEKASQTILGGLFGTRFPFITEGAYPYNSYLSNDSLFKIQSDVIRHLAEKQSWDEAEQQELEKRLEECPELRKIYTQLQDGGTLSAAFKERQKYSSRKAYRSFLQKIGQVEPKGQRREQYRWIIMCFLHGIRQICQKREKDSSSTASFRFVR